MKILSFIRVFLLSLLFVFTAKSYGQYDDYLGAGHSQGITVTSSSNYQPWGWEQTALGENTINGNGLEGRLMEASRFLTQATLGATPELIEQLAATDFEEWIDQQSELQATLVLDTVRDIYARARQWFIDDGGDPEDYAYWPYNQHFLYGWWQVNMTAEDVLRQRVALALSEIMVISYRDVLDDFGEAQAAYYDLLIDNALGNYEELLLQVAVHPAMGVYLSHFNNPKAIPADNIHPDENFAREIMQLFTIGLFELNPDGSKKLDNNGSPIPTYDIFDIKEFAKVFTGLGPGALIENEWLDEPEFGVPKWITDMTVPMAMYEDWHQQGEKKLLNGFVIPAGQSGMEDVEAAVHHLFMHPNVGPFIVRHLIQNMVKSNPTPAYIARVSAVFDNNGEGERGDLKAVVKAILLDTEARDCNWVNHPQQGKLREPMMRYFNFCRAVDKNNTYEGVYWNIGYEFWRNTGQLPLASPSVFNFFLPDFQPVGPIADADLYGPEFQIHNSLTSLGYINSVDDWVMWGVLMDSWEVVGTAVTIDISQLTPLAKDPEVLVNKLDVLLTHGGLSDETRYIILTALDYMRHDNLWSYYLEYRVKMALYLIMISPDYAILK
ncbi:MAG: DUF1800 domain-containing protein [Bacteroidales bacterium]|nr:DUF1800 domain-containing protein [Bacteroidales bacterium]